MKSNQLKQWLIETYAEAGIQGLRIDSVMGAIDDELKEIKEKGMFDKRFNVSKNISILLYRSGTFEVHISRPEISTYESFTVESDEPKSLLATNCPPSGRTQKQQRQSPMKLLIFTITFFDRLQWKTREFDVFAENEEQMREFVNSQCELHYRTEENLDTLKIIDTEEVVIPYGNEKEYK